MVMVVNSLWAQEQKPMRIAVVGLVHTHVHWILNRAADGDFQLVGVLEDNAALAERYFKQYNLPSSLLYTSMEEMLEATQPQAVTAFNTIRDHLEVVEHCAPRGIHVMVEKPLAVNLEHARKMVQLAKEHNIHLLTNYETTWYGSNHFLHNTLEEEAETFGDVRKIVVHDGHPGPQEIGVDKEFLEWLIDPYWNGAGALTDFGCYGANLSTWLHNGQKPLSVMAVTQQIKPHIYPKVDDEATIVLTYPKAQTIIQASWNWNYNRKDMEVYTQHGFIHALNGTDVRVMRSEKEGAKELKAPALNKPTHDPFTYLMAVVRGDFKPQPEDLSSLENNLTVMEILEAAKISAKEGRVVKLTELQED